jgi:hypothetical protein
MMEGSRIFDFRNCHHEKWKWNAIDAVTFKRAWSLQTNARNTTTRIAERCECYLSEFERQGKLLASCRMIAITGRRE